MEKSSYSGFERFLFFLTPIIFTIILVLVLLTFFNYDVKNSLFALGNKIPIVNSFIPDSIDPLSDDNTGNADGETSDGSNETQSDTDGVKVKNLELELTMKNAELKKTNDTVIAQGEEIKVLEQKIEDMTTEVETEAQSDEEYQKQIKGLADLYANMTASKAAPVIENLTLSEQALVLSQMNIDARTKILEKMDPKKAAEASIQLKDTVSMKDRQVAALQERIKKFAESTAQASKVLTKTDLALTVASMTPKKAAEMLLAMNKFSPDKVISILSSMDTTSRSNIMTSLADLSGEITAKIAAKLVK